MDEHTAVLIAAWLRDLSYDRSGSTVEAHRLSGGDGWVVTITSPLQQGRLVIAEAYAEALALPAER